MKIRRLLIFALCTFAVGLTLRYGIRKFSVFGSIAGNTAPLKEPIAAYTRSLRPKYPYSIIPGGAYSADELRYADQEDPVVKEHYAGFDMKKARMVQLTDDRYEYVSYRLKKKVFWTKKKLRIPKGEVLLTDGGSWARARCGNRLSDKPQKMVSNEEPPSKDLALPPMELGTSFELAENPPLSQYTAIAPGNIDKFPPVLPPNDAPPPPELPPLVPVIPITSVMPMLPPIFTPPVGPPGTPPPPGNPPLVPPTGPPIVVPPPGTPPPVTSVPEPKAVYLFLITFVLSLYGLTRMIPANERAEAQGGDDGSKS